MRADIVGEGRHLAHRHAFTEIIGIQHVQGNELVGDRPGGHTPAAGPKSHLLPSRRIEVVSKIFVFSPAVQAISTDPSSANEIVCKCLSINEQIRL